MKEKNEHKITSFVQKGMGEADRLVCELWRGVGVERVYIARQSHRLDRYTMKDIFYSHYVIV